MTHEQLSTRLRDLCQGIDEEILRDFLTRMDPDYLVRFPAEEVARHVRLIAGLDPGQPCRVEITQRTDEAYDLVIAAYDYFSEFATICGLLTAFGLDIREGSIYTYIEATPPKPTASPYGVRQRLPGRRRPGLAGKRIVDYFVVRPLSGGPWPAPDQQRFGAELTHLLQLLDHHKFQDARQRINRHLVELLGRSRGTFTGLLYPVHITFDNEQFRRDTVMDIRSTDTPAFLYAFANALSMRGVYISKAHIENVGPELHDQLYVRDRHGHKITDIAVQNELRATAVLIKQFTHFLTWAPDPAKAIEYFDQFLDRILEETRGATGTKALAFLKQQNTLALLARLLGSSDFLWEDFLRRQHANVLPLLETFQRLPLVRPKADLGREVRRQTSRARSEEDRRRVLNAFKDQEMFRIDMKHLTDTRAPIQEFSTALTELAEVVLGETVRISLAKLSRQYGAPRLKNRTPCAFAVLGAGKCGGRELGYASDVEVLFVYRGAGRTSGRRSIDNSEFFERVAQELLSWVEARREGIFHLDVRLRPHGSKGQLANTPEEIQRYYGPSGLSAPFERQALIKLRAVAGDEDLGREVERVRDSLVYSGAPWNLATALDLRAAQIKELVAPDQINVKYSPGGLIDVEYAVQYLQLMHGHRHAELRTPNTLEALAALGKLSIVSADDCRELRDAYLMFRLLIDGLRIVRGHAKDLVLPPTDSESFLFLARRVGYISADWQEGAAKLEVDISRHMAKTRAFFENRFCQS